MGPVVFLGISIKMATQFLLRTTALVCLITNILAAGPLGSFSSTSNDASLTLPVNATSPSIHSLRYIFAISSAILLH